MGWRGRSRRSGASRRPGDSGFSLFELVVTMAVLAIGLALVGRLLIESQLGLARAQAELGNPLPRYALARIRSDLQGTLGVAAPAILPGWRSSPLVLVIEGGDRIAWQRSEDDLERVIRGPSGEVLVRHVALRGVADWRWRPTADGGLVDVELVYRMRDTSAVPLVGVARTWSPPAAERSVWMRVALRARGGAP